MKASACGRLALAGFTFDALSVGARGQHSQETAERRGNQGETEVEEGLLSRLVYPDTAQRGNVFLDLTEQRRGRGVAQEVEDEDRQGPRRAALLRTGDIGDLCI